MNANLFGILLIPSAPYEWNRLGVDVNPNLLDYRFYGH